MTIFFKPKPLRWLLPPYSEKASDKLLQATAFPYSKYEIVRINNRTFGAFYMEGPSTHITIHKGGDIETLKSACQEHHEEQLKKLFDVATEQDLHTAGYTKWD